MKLKIAYSFFFILLIQNLYSQDFNKSFCVNPIINKNDSNKLFLRVENTNFFKNDEYFGELTSGLTYIGAFVRPTLVYYPYSKVKITAGAHLLKYSGLDIVSQVLPVFSFQYQPTEGINFIMGSLYGAANHSIVEPMYSFEHYLINNLENGIQLLIDKSRFYTDIWVNWEKFILKTSHSQEHILGGIHSNYIISGKKESSNLKIDFQSIFAHKGGQYHDEGETLQTLVNMSFALKYIKKIDSKYLKSLGFDAYYLTYNDVSPLPQLPYTMGYAIYSEAFINTKLIGFKVGYWSGEYYISSKGNPLFMSVSEKNQDFLLPRTELITAKIALRKQWFKDVVFEARFEPYLDLQQRQFEYSYSVYVVFNRNFFLKKL